MIKRSQILCSAAVSIAVLLSGSAADAQNLVQNPGFENGTSANASDDWALKPTGSFTAFTGSPHTGSFAAYFGNGDIQGSGIISQTIATVPMTEYIVSFFLQNTGGPSNDFLATFDNQTVLTLHDSAAFGYTQYSATVAADSSSAVLAFSGGSGPAAFDVDDVDVEAAPAPLPGAGIMSSVAALLFAFGVAYRKRFEKA